MDDERMKIGALAERAGVTPRTIRYYESLGLLRPAERVGAGFRYYAYADLERLLKIEGLKELGLTLDEIGQVIEILAVGPALAQGRQRLLALLRGHLTETRTKIGHLQALERDLAQNVARMEQFFNVADGQDASASDRKEETP